MLPNLLICGVNKAGTTGLYMDLVSHPEISGGRLKEALYFLAYRYHEVPEPISVYERNFDNSAPAKYIIDGTPGYFYGGLPVINAIKKKLGAVKVIVVLRDPVARTFSSYRFAKSMLQIPRHMSFLEYLNACEKLSHEEVSRRDNDAYWGVEGGHYIKWIRAWINAFGDDLKVIFFDDLESNRQATLNSIGEWLGVTTDNFNVDATSIENRTVSLRSVALQKVGLTINRRFEPFFRRHPKIKRRIRDIYYSINEASESEHIDNECRARLDEIYRRSNADLEEYLRVAGIKKLPKWLHDCK